MEVGIYYPPSALRATSPARGADKFGGVVQPTTPPVEKRGADCAFEVSIYAYHKLPPLRKAQVGAGFKLSLYLLSDSYSFSIHICNILIHSDIQIRLYILVPHFFENVTQSLRIVTNVYIMRMLRKKSIIKLKRFFAPKLIMGSE